MYKWIKLMADILFLIVGVTILAYLHLLNSSRPTCIHDCVSPIVPRTAGVVQPASTLIPEVKRPV